LDTFRPMVASSVFGEGVSEDATNYEEDEE